MKVIEAKIVVLGSQGVGKTSLVVRYIGKMFSKHISPTIGASFFTCNINVGDARVKLQVWDTAGQERFRSMAPMYYRNANAALLVFDITSVTSFAAIKSWVKELQSNVPENMVLSVVGNKCDLDESRAVSRSEATQYAASIGAHYCETSALHDQGIDQVFLSTATELLEMSESNSMSSMRSYDSSDGSPSEEAATHTGKVELPAWSVDSIAHGELQKNMCC
ncbi:ras-related protein Rab-31 isoform X2 [Amyelois transitella]|uniref:ras-related protein Rab-31 isoform X2 n=1 Tax=Amyelois transitella TaxID=680683 RepID=UPI00298FD654|nr:ras-related protein Rab-31 isoform X2 [Amyelois transitella]